MSLNNIFFIFLLFISVESKYNLFKVDMYHDEILDNINSELINQYKPMDIGFIFVKKPYKFGPQSQTHSQTNTQSQTQTNTQLHNKNKTCREIISDCQNKTVKKIKRFI